MTRTIKDSDLDFSIDPFKHYQSIKDYLDSQFNRLSEKYKLKPVEIDSRLCNNKQYKEAYCQAKELYLKRLKPENCGDIYEAWLFNDLKQADYIEFVELTRQCLNLFKSVFEKIN